jgi:hypothetical protein
MGSAETYLRQADEALVRAHAAELIALGVRHGVHDLRFASTGRLVGRLDKGMDALDVAAFAADAEELLSAEVLLLSETVLNHPNVSPDLIEARPI